MEEEEQRRLIKDLKRPALHASYCGMHVSIYMHATNMMRPCSCKALMFAGRAGRGRRAFNLGGLRHRTLEFVKVRRDFAQPLRLDLEDAEDVRLCRDCQFVEEDPCARVLMQHRKRVDVNALLPADGAV